MSNEIAYQIYQKIDQKKEEEETFRKGNKKILKEMKRSIITDIKRQRERERDIQTIV